MRSLALLTLTPFLVLPLGGCLGFKVNVSRIDNASYPAPTSVVQIRSSNGAISVTGGEVDEVQVEAKITAYGQTEEAAQAVLDGSELEFLEEDGVLTVQLASDSPKFASAAFKVIMPRDLECRMDSSNGAIDARDLNARVVADTSNGAVAIRNVGDEIKVKTSNGAILVQSETPATIDLKTSNGSVKFTGALFGAQNRFATSNGRIEMDLLGPATLVTPSTSNGSITLDGTKIKKGETILVGSDGDADPASITVKTSNGSIKIRDKSVKATGDSV
ncbi:MAG: hypothetical protein AAFV88_08965 [Planctomycetota bacterium]